ncbi:MAG: hypothetical protein IJW40_08565, partial [Clostridia bacterium]|nr:hypothetical protein [Clostridia bacterium]
MKIKIVAMILLIIFLLSSCTPVEKDLPQNQEITEKPPAPNGDSDEGGAVDISASTYRDLLPACSGDLLWEGNDFMITSEGTMIHTDTAETLSLCFDPLCAQEGHLNNTCPALAIAKGQQFIISPQESQDTLVIYADTYKSRTNTAGTSYMPQFIRYDQATQTIEVLADGVNLMGTTWQFDPYTKTIYYLAYRAESPTQMSLYALDTTTKEIRYLTDPPEQMFASCIKEQILYFYGVTSIYSLDLEDPETGCVLIHTFETPCRPRNISGGYVYFDLRERTYYSVSQEALDRYGETFDAQDMQNLTWHDAIYRVPLDDPDAEPELILENVSIATIQNGIMLYVKHEPHPAFSYVIHNGKYYHWDDPAAPPEGDLIHVFAWDSGSGGIIDLATMEELVTFEL